MSSAGVYPEGALARLRRGTLAARTGASARTVHRKRHTAGLSLLALIALWLCRRVIFTSAFPAGTDLLGFVTRARQNAGFSQVLSPWSPSSLGAVRQFTLDNLLGALTLAVGSPLVVVKLLMVATLFASGAFAYALSWRWYRNGGAAVFAGAFFMVSQASLTRWGSGELNVEIAVAFAPLLLLLWDGCVSRPTPRRVALFGTAIAGVLFVRLDMVLYIAPFLFLQLAVRVAMSRRPLEIARRAARASVLAGCALCLVLASQLLPLLMGIRAHWLTTQTLFRQQDFSQRTLDAYPSLLGFGREIGYLAFTGEQTWYSHPWVPASVYDGAATALLLLALGGLWWHRGHRSVFLALSIPFGVFLAKGIRPPLAEPYLFAIRHVPVFGNLRDANRWLIVSSLAVAVLGGLVASRVVRLLARGLPNTLVGRTGVVTATAVGLSILILPVGPTIVRGFMTWRPTPDQAALLTPVAKDKSEFTVATIPYDQTYRFLTAGGYRGYEHDLGAESATFTNHAALADGGWHQPTADFVAFTSTLLGRRDPAFAKLLGTMGIKYLVDFSYPETAPHLLPASVLAGRHSPSTGSLSQQRAWNAQHPGSAVIANLGGATYRLPGWSPPLSFRTNLAVVLGGTSGAAALADDPGIHLDQWAVVTAQDALDHGGLRRLLSLMRTSDAVIVSNDPVRSTAVLATPALADVAGVTSDPGLDRLTELLPSDQSDRLGSLANSTLPASQPGASKFSTRFRLHRPRTVELWSRMETSPTAAALAFRVDGRVVRRTTPVAVGSGAMIWRLVGRFTLSVGIHTLSVRATPSLFGDSFEIDEVRLVDAAQRARTQRAITAEVNARPRHTLFAFDVRSLPLGLGSPSLYQSRETIGSSTGGFWRVLDPSEVRIAVVRARVGGNRALRLTISGRRRFYTIVQHTFDTPRDWRGRGYVFLAYRGAGTGNTYHLYVDFDRDHVHSAVYDLADDAVGWQTIALSVRNPDHGVAPFSWGHVVSVRIASDARDLTGALTLGQLGLSGRLGSVAIRYGLPCDLPAHAVVEGAGIHVKRSECAVTMKTTSTSVSPAARVIEGARVRERAPASVTFRRTGPTSYDFAVDSKTRGWLMLAQGFDTRWIARSGDARLSSTPLFATVNGFPLAAGLHAGTVSFRGAAWASVGVGVSGLSFLGLLGIVVLNPWAEPRRRYRRPRRRGLKGRSWPLSRRRPSFWTLCLAAAAVVIAGPVSVPLSLAVGALIFVVYRISWRMCLCFAGILLAVAPVVQGRSADAANVLAIDVTALVAAAAVLVLTEERSRFTGV